jgi:hypothetical protein
MIVIAISAVKVCTSAMYVGRAWGNYKTMITQTVSLMPAICPSILVEYVERHIEAGMFTHCSATKNISQDFTALYTNMI